MNTDAERSERKLLRKDKSHEICGSDSVTGGSGDEDNDGRVGPREERVTLNT